MSDILYRNLNPDYVTFRKELAYRSQVGLCVVDALKKRKYTRSQQNWDIFWVQKECLDNFYANHRVNKNQRVNHYRTYYELCKKDNLNRNLKKYRRQLERQGKTNQASQYNFIPLTYHLPIQYAVFLDEFKRISNANKNNVWIMKPTAKSQGKGIFLFNKINAIQDWAENPDAENYICQKYIDNPLLIGHKKFDLRLYVLCTSYRPLNIYLYREGFARFTHHRFEPQDISNSQMHLTNVAIQKQTSEYNKSLGGKMSLTSLKVHLLSKYHSEKRNQVNNCFAQINSLIIKTLKSVTKIMSNETNCFELYGFDIMLDDNLFPWLIQINGSPSMRANTKADKQLKIGLIDDMMSVIDLQGVRTGDEDVIGGFDLICKNDTKYENQYYYGVPGMSMLGCKLERQKNYRLMAMNLNTHYKNNKQVLSTSSPNKQLKRPSMIDDSISPVKKGFSVRKQKRPNSFAKNQGQEKIQLPTPQNSIALINSQHSQSSSLSTNSPTKKVQSQTYNRNIRESSNIFNKTNSSTTSNQGLNTPAQQITFLPQSGKVIPKNTDKSKLFVRKISINKK